VNSGDYLTAREAGPLVEYALTGAGGRRFAWAADRKLRLFNVAIFWDAVRKNHSLKPRWRDESFRACEAAKKLADGSLVTFSEFSNISMYLVMRTHDMMGATALELAAERPNDLDAHYFREIFGNPFDPVPVYCNVCDEATTVGPGYCAFGTGQGSCQGMTWRPGIDWYEPWMSTLAEAIYKNEEFDELPKLADCLLDKGCADEALVKHLQGFEPCVKTSYPPFPNNMAEAWTCADCNNTEWRPLRVPHVKGCWALDVLRCRWGE